MESSRHTVYHPSIERYYHVLEIKDRIPAKKTYQDPRLCAEEGLRIGQEKYKNNLLNVYVMKTDRNGKDTVVDCWRP